MKFLRLDLSQNILRRFFKIIWIFFSKVILIRSWIILFEKNLNPTFWLKISYFGNRWLFWPYRLTGSSPLLKKWTPPIIDFLMFPDILKNMAILTLPPHRLPPPPFSKMDPPKIDSFDVSDDFVKKKYLVQKKNWLRNFFRFLWELIFEKGEAVRR